MLGPYTAISKFPIRIRGFANEIHYFWLSPIGCLLIEPTSLTETSARIGASPALLAAGLGVIMPAGRDKGKKKTYSLGKPRILIGNSL